MSTKQDWRERWEEKDRDGREVVDVATWSDGTPCIYSWRGTGGREAQSVFIGDLIPSKPAPVVVPWEPDEVPVGAVIRHKDTETKHVILGKRIDDETVSFDIGGYGSATPKILYYSFVLHQPGIPTEQCQPCGKVVQP